jgi:hypothetical protein
VPEERSLEEIEKDYWGAAPANATRLIQTVHELRRRPIGSLGVEDLRVLIGQKVGVAAVMPLALERLEQDPLAEGDYYPGDLLVAVLGIPRDYWERHPDQHAKVDAVVDRLDPADVDDALGRDVAVFRLG